MVQVIHITSFSNSWFTCSLSVKIWWHQVLPEVELFTGHMTVLFLAHNVGVWASIRATIRTSYVTGRLSRWTIKEKRQNLINDLSHQNFIVCHPHVIVSKDLRLNDS